MSIPSLSVRISEVRESAYPIAFGSLSSHSKFLQQILENKTCVIITDSRVKRLYGKSVLSVITKLSRRPVHLVTFSAGEKSKTQTTKTRLEHSMLQKKCGRDTVVIALGGGVVGDIAGFVAATYCRGIPFVQIPTTLLAMVDSSIGGKVAIDTPFGKNMIGSFWQPSAVFIDPSFLETLPASRLVEGLCEAVKMCLTHDAFSFEWTEKRLRDRLEWKSDTWVSFIRQALVVKGGVVSRDEREAGERATLNFGHTIAHAIERVSTYRVSHGLAVGIGVCVESVLSCQLGYLSTSECERILACYADLGIDGSLLRGLEANALIEATRNDKKGRGGKPRYVLLEGIGKVYQKNKSWTHEVSDSAVKKALHEYAGK